MLKLKKIALTITAVAVAGSAVAQDAKTFDQKASYAIGYAFGQNFLTNLIATQKDVINYDNAKILAGVKDALDNTPTMTDKQIGEVLNAIEQKVQTAQTLAVENGNKALAERFLKEPNVKKTASGLLYRIINPGKDTAIKADDIVKVEYEGQLSNGQVFDASSHHNGAIEFPVNGVIKGWQEGLQLLKKGGEMEMVIPANLAYGDHGAGSIPANASLFFKVKVLDVKPAK